MENTQPDHKRSQCVVTPSKPLHEIDRRIYGHFIEHLGMCIENGIWSYDETEQPMAFGRVRSDVFEAMKSLKPTALRWPGGCFADGYHWMDGIGPAEGRPARRNRAWGWQGAKLGPRERNHFGTDEFLRLCKELGAEPLINANLGSGTPAEAARWVEYCNGGPNTPMGALRAENGHPDPYGVKLWGLGNEMWGPYETGWCPTGAIYARRYIRYHKAMTAVDPGLKCMAVGGNPIFKDWNRKLLKLAAGRIDFLSFHAYAPELDPLTMNLFPGIKNDERHYWPLVAAGRFFEDRLRWFQGTVEDALGPDSELPIAFDEWNLWWSSRQIHRAEDYTLRDGVAVAGALNAIQRLPWLKMANFAQMVNAIGLIITDSRGLFVTPSYLVMKLYTELAGDRLAPSRVQCDTFPTSPLGGIPAYSDLPILDVSATMDADGRRAAVFLVNRDFSAPNQVTLRFEGFQPGAEAVVYSISSDSPFSMNSFDEPFRILTMRENIRLTEPALRLVMPPHSVFAVECGGR